MGELNNPIKDFYEKQKNIITIPEEEIEKSTNQINQKMQEYNIEYKFKLFKSIEAACKSYLTF